MFTVLARPGDVAALEELIFRETTTFGIRRFRATREKLERCRETVDTRFGPIRVKVGSRGGVVYTASPEYEDCRRAAEASGAPLKEVMRAATRAWETRDT